VIVGWDILFVKRFDLFVCIIDRHYTFKIVSIQIFNLWLVIIAHLKFLLRNLN